MLVLRYARSPGCSLVRLGDSDGHAVMPRFGRSDPFAQTQTLVLRLEGSDARTRSLGGSGSDTRMVRLRLGGSDHSKSDAQSPSLGCSVTQTRTLTRSDSDTHVLRLGGSDARTRSLGGSGSDTRMFRLRLGGSDRSKSDALSPSLGCSLIGTDTQARMLSHSDSDAHSLRLRHSCT